MEVAWRWRPVPGSPSGSLSSEMNRIGCPENRPF